MENWKDIPGYEGLYQVSDCGQVKSCERVVYHPRNGSRKVKERILKFDIHKQGYYLVSLFKEGKMKKFLLHRLIMYSFVGIRDDMTVNHIDEDKSNNHLSNLEYVTQADNNRAWNKNNPERRTEINTRASEARSKEVLDTQTGKIFTSIKSASRYMYEKESAKGIFTWFTKIRTGNQNRFKIINN